MLHLRHVPSPNKHLSCLSRFSSKGPHRGLHANHSIYVSKSTDPYFNLSLEDWLFRHKSPKEPLLLLYRDDPCVVIGRNQNPWKEVNLSVSRQTGIPWIRRRSGGGTVYHDLGNTNFSIHLPRSTFDRNETAQVVLRAVRSLGVDANVNDRNDICIGKEKICSAYKIVNSRAYHHGTMLISTDLSTLGDLLHTDKETMVTKGIASVRSPVRNLQQYTPSVNHEKFVDAVIDSFRKEYNVDAPIHEVEDTEEARNIDYIRNGIEELPRWDWAFGQTPEFTYTFGREFECGSVAVNIHSKHGVILDCTIDCPNSNEAVRTQLKDLGSRLAGQKYAFVEESVLDLSSIDDAVIRDVWAWLKGKMDC